jgi:hypothetical protein
MSTDYLIRLLKPTTISVYRQKPGRATMGDRAEARLEPGILDFLSCRTSAGSLPLGAGILPTTVILHSAAATAAYLALGDHERAHKTFDWSGGELDETYTRPVRLGEALIGRARLKEMRRLVLLVGVETASADTGEKLMTGEIRFVAIRDGRALQLRDRLLVFERDERA